ncbi:hypothetical protein GCM10011386_38250 [Parapedobacter defluvii]|uniref:Sce7726 family protein n=1 Tax=Parapedobacter defluvii TaxID=2045106 RepID=A0ABQ1MPV0_9SPHI|nr:hypothetical protein GCM10011386_38250 [Parapedobacter defluvii]
MIDELGLKNGAIRADIAVLNGSLIGYEIKTDRDNLSRLIPQVGVYSEIFDKAYIITGKRHLNKILEKVPKWWGIYLIEQEDKGLYNFNCLRKSEVNDRKNAYSMAQLLWKEEVIKILEDYFDCEPKQSWTRDKLYTLLAEKCDINTLGNITLGILKNRQGWRINRQLPL